MLSKPEILKKQNSVQENGEQSKTPLAFHHFKVESVPQDAALAAKKKRDQEERARGSKREQEGARKRKRRNPPSRETDRFSFFVKFGLLLKFGLPQPFLDIARS